MLVALASLVGGCGENFARDYVVENGSCCGFRIGQTREEVAATLRGRGVTSVDPVDARHIVVKRSTTSRLSELQSARGICTGDNKGYAIQVRFDSSDRVDHLFLSVPAQGNSYGIAMGQPRKFVLSRFREALRTHSGLVVSNCLPGIPALSLQSSRLDAFEAWFFYEPGTFSCGKLIFAGDTLARIEYHYRPHEET